MARWLLTGNYGTFTIEREVEAPDVVAATNLTGIMTTLEEAGWEIVSSPDGEVWEVECLDDDAEWVEPHWGDPGQGEE